jgi:hypothetical protein
MVIEMVENKWTIQVEKKIRVHSCSFVAETLLLEF